MSRRTAVSFIAFIILATSAFAVQQSTSSSDAPLSSLQESSNQRYIIYDPSGGLPMLLDSKTGRTWYRAIPKDMGRAVWIPMIVVNDDAQLNYHLPPDPPR